MRYCVLYTAWVLFLNLICTHYTTSGLPINHQTEVWWFNGRVKTRIIGEARIKTDKIDSEALAYMLKSEMLPKIYIPTKISMENKLLLRSRISLVVLRTSIKNKVHAIIDRNRDSYKGLESKTDIFCRAGMIILRDTEIPNPDYMIAKNYLDLIDELNKKFSK